MKNYAIVQLQGKQYMIDSDTTLEIDSLPDTVGDTLTVSDVLFVSSDAGVSIGSPTVAGASVTFNVESHQKSDKIRVAKFRSKSRYRKVYGHRQPKTTLTVKKLTFGK